MNQPLPTYPALAPVTAADPSAAAFHVLGFSAPGDGGEATWIALPDAPPPGDAVRLYHRRIGDRWFRCMARPGFDPRALGAKGDGITDDTAAIGDAILLTADVELSRGRYAVRRILVEQPAAIRGRQGATLVARDTTSNPWLDALLHITCGGCIIEGLDFEAAVATDLVPIGPTALLLIEDRDPAYLPSAFADAEEVKFRRIASVTVRNARFRGGRNGCFATAIDDGTFENLRFEDTQGYGIAIMSGARRLMMRGIRVHGTLNAEGIKIGYWRADVLAEQILLTDFIVTDCGKLAIAPDVKEGIDLFMGAVRSLMVTNGVIDGCSGGGIEIKTRHTGLPKDIYQHVLVSDLLIRNRCQQKGIALLWTAERFLENMVNRADSAGRVLIANIRIWYDFADPREKLTSKAAAIVVTAWRGVTLRGLDIEGAGVAFYLTGGNASGDETARDVTIESCRVRDTMNALYATTGKIEGLRLANCDFETWERTLLFSGASVDALDVRDSRFVQNGVGRETNSRYTVDARRLTGARFVRCRIVGEHIAIFAQKDPSREPLTSRDVHVIDCDLAVDAIEARAFIRLDDAVDWRIEGNRFSGGKPATPDVLVLSDKQATFASNGNRRG